MIDLTEDQQIKFREYLKSILSVQIKEIVFEKNDKTVRVMYGTRDKDIIGEELYEQYINPVKPRVEPITSVSVFDTNINAWRAFTINKLISINGINTNDLLKYAQIIEEDQHGL